MSESELQDELKRLQQVERAARCYRFAGSEESFAFLRDRGWVGGERGLWYAPDRIEPAASPWASSPRG